MKLPLPTTVSTVPPYRRLTAVKAITATVLQNVRRLTATTAGTERRQYPLVRVTPVVLITPIVRPKSAPGLAIPDIHNQEARALKTTPVTTVRRFRCRPTPTARPTTPTAPPNVPPGAVTQGIQSQEARATSLRLPTKAPEEIVAEQPVV